MRSNGEGVTKELGILYRCGLMYLLCGQGFHLEKGKEYAI